MNCILKNNLNKIYLLGDLAALFLAAVLALVCRFGFNYSFIPFDRYISVFLWISFAIIFLMYSYKLYRREFKSYLPQIPVIAKSIFYSLLLFFLFTFFDRSTEYSRLMIGYYAFFSFMLLILFRRLSFIYILSLYAKGIGVKRVLGVGIDKNSCAVLNYLIEHKEFGYQVVGILQDLLEGEYAGTLAVEVVGDLDDFEAVIPRLDVQTVLISSRDKKRVREIIAYCEEKGYEILLLPDIIDLMISPVQVTTFTTMPLIGFKETPLCGDQGKLKRLLDIIGSGLGLIFLSPLFLLIMLAIRLDDGGPVFFRQERLGVGGKKILLWKFRTMVLDAETRLETLLKENEALRLEYSTTLKLKNDPRITRCGAFLRRFSLDELPQLINVFLGEMSLVGPRPYLEREFKNELKESSGFKYYILLVPPGITGLWQVSGRSDVSPEERVRMDVYYINNWTLWLDIFLLLKTIPAVLARKGAY